MLMCSAILQDLDPKKLQITLTGFLEKNTSLFVKVRHFMHLDPVRHAL